MIEFLEPIDETCSVLNDGKELGKIYKERGRFYFKSGNSTTKQILRRGLENVNDACLAFKETWEQQDYFKRRAAESALVEARLKLDEFKTFAKLNNNSSMPIQININIEKVIIKAPPEKIIKEVLDLDFKNSRAALS